MKKVIATIPDAFEEQLRIIASEEGRSLSSLISYAIEKFLREYQPINAKDRKNN